jgi:hypothetical protein
MQFIWQVEQADINRIQAFVTQQAANPFVRTRTSRNLSEAKPAVDPDEFWRQMVGMRLTSVQRSGPDSHVARFLRKDPFPLAYTAVNQQNHVQSFIANVLKAHGGIRFTDRIANDLSRNYQVLQGGEWNTALEKVNKLTILQEPATERAIARYVQGLLVGFGPKQARNFLQALGLTRYEIPIDSRIAKWLTAFGFPMRLNASTLADSDYYEFALDGILSLCKAADIFPCILDAAIFSSFDGDGWTEENVVY